MAASTGTLITRAYLTLFLTLSHQCRRILHAHYTHTTAVARDTPHSQHAQVDKGSHPREASSRMNQSDLLYPSYSADPYLAYQPAFAYSLAIQLFVNGITITLLLVLLIHFLCKLWTPPGRQG